MRLMRNAERACSGLHELSVEADRYILADQYSACFKSGVPRQPEILPVDLCHSREAYPSVAPRILSGRSRTLHIEHHLPRDAVDREITRDCQFVIAFALDAGRTER